MQHELEQCCRETLALVRPLTDAHCTSLSPDHETLTRDFACRARRKTGAAFAVDPASSNPVRTTKATCEAFADVARSNRAVETMLVSLVEAFSGLPLQAGLCAHLRTRLSWL